MLLIDLELPKSKKHPGLYIHCPKCNGFITHENHKKCNHKGDQKYRISMRHPVTGRNATKLLLTKNYDEAVKATIDFKNALRSNVSVIPNEDEIKPDNLVMAIAMYIDYLENINVPYHKRRNRNPVYVNDQKFGLKLFLSFLRDICGYDPNQIRVNDINDFVVGQYYEYLEKKHTNNHTFNNRIQAMITFYNYLINQKKYKIFNPFNKTKKSASGNTNVPESDELTRLFEAINQENGIEILPNGKKRNHYNEWIKDSIMWMLFLGRRPGEIVTLRFSDLGFEDDTPIYIKGEDVKVNRKRNIDPKDFDNKKYFYAPVFKQFRQFLIEQGVLQYRDTDRFLIAPYITDRKRLSERMSRAFSHFWVKAGNTRRMTLYNLRDLYLTKAEIQTKGKAIGISNHKSKRVLIDHYLNSEMISKAIAESDFSIL